VIRREASRSEQGRLAAGFFAVIDLAIKVLARQQTRTCVCSLRAGKLAGGKSRGQDGPRPIAYAILATQCLIRSERVQSEVNLAELMAPEDQKFMHLQRLENSNMRRLWRLIIAFGEGPAGGTGEKRC
jgi:hypothetical protein